MQCLNVYRAVCAICGNTRQPGETWFLISENDWEDRLKIWRWDREAGAQKGMHSVCGQRHVRELVVHWMTTGCLHYPFAEIPSSSQNKRFKPLSPDIHLGSRRVPEELGEVAVDREAVARALVENPSSLNAVLDELAIVLENEALGAPEVEEDEPIVLYRNV